ncbi:DUF624 domain-containing protein [Lapidilactobacillus achengensis]|uniref:DUF624 domain-containing protein n=1 Tax=Lapidilactobacillus achengensis TaxID=2486000 RepID=A0ABW1UQ27_9LACO|nr:DUF624 domain-containing protein [Lapidilactobacillus achengensis]
MGWSEKLMKVLYIIEIVLFLNLLWIGGALIGLGVLGIFPATRALYQLISRELFNYDGGGSSFKSLAKEFWRNYKSEFKSVNKFGIIYLLIYGVLYFDFVVITQLMKGAVYAAFLPIVTVVLFYVILTNIFLLMNDSLEFSWTHIKKILVLPFALPGASLLYAVFIIVFSLLAIRFSVIFILCYFSAVLIVGKVFLQMRIQKKGFTI